MKRPKTKWRFQNIVVFSFVCVAVFEQASAEDTTKIEDITLSARSLPKTPSNPPAPPGIKGSLKDFRMPEAERFWEVHGVERSAAHKKAIDRLSAHLVGTSREKTAAFKYCDARKKDAASDPRFVLTPDGIGCLYYRWQNLLRERKEAERKAIAASGIVQHKKKKSVSGKKKSTPATVGIASARDFKAYADVPYDVVLKRVEFKTESAALRAANFALDDGKDCSLTAARAAILRDLENYLPAQAVWQTMNQLYTVTAPCLHPQHEAFEVVNLRMALMHLDRKELNRAASLLEVVLQGKDLKEEHSALFWRGYLDHLQTPTSTLVGPFGISSDAEKNRPRNTYWDRLVERYPLTLHSLVVDHINGVDTYERYASRAAPMVSMYQGQEWNLENVAHLMAGIFMVNKSYPQLERLARLLDESGDSIPSFEMAMFRLKLFEAAGNQRAIIKIIWASLKKHGSNYLCEDLLVLLYPVKFRNEIAEQAAFIDPALIFSLIRQESSFNPRATSPVGARGLMQVMPGTARKIERRRGLDLYDPSSNIRVGSKYLSILRKQHNGDYSRLIASYNAGPNSTKKWDARYNGNVHLLFADIIPFPETRHYVSGLMRHMYWYRALVSHLKEAPGAVKIQWSWSLQDVIPKPEQFGLKKGEILQVKLEQLPWLNAGAVAGEKASAENK